MFLNIALQPQRDAKSAAKAKGNTSLLESLSAVQSALDSIPDNVVPMPKTVSEAFQLTDPVLSMLHKQLRDAKSNRARLMGFGNDPMIEALATQITAIEIAYNTRLTALRDRREASKRAKNKTAEPAKPQQHCKPANFAYKPRERKNKNLAWIWMLMIDSQMKQDEKKKATFKAA